MTTTRTPPGPPSADEALPGARELFAPGPSAALLEAFLAPRGWQLVEARGAQATYWPGSSCVVRYRVRARAERGPERWLTLCAETRARARRGVDPGPAGPLSVDPPLDRLGHHLVWAFPYDPVLRGLPDAARGSTVRRGLRTRGPTGVSVSLVRYRPGRRAILRYRVTSREGASTLFGKVMREPAVARTFDAYRNLRRSGPRLAEPASHPIPGLVTFPILDGTSLGARLVAGDRLPAPDKVLRLMASMGAAAWRGEPKPRRYERSVRSTGRLLRHLLPTRGAEVSDLTEDLAERAKGLVPTSVVHGDLYESQVFVDDDATLGLIDLEDAGPGDALLDAANLLAHLGALAAAVPAAGGRPLAYATLLRRSLLGAGVPPEELAWREALCALLLAPWPFASRSPRWPDLVDGRISAAARALRRRER